MPNAIEHGISTAHKNYNVEKIFFLAFKLSDVVFSMQINVKLPLIVDILTFTFMSMMNFMRSLS